MSNAMGGVPTILQPALVCAIAGFICFFCPRRGRGIMAAIAVLAAVWCFALGIKLFGSGAGYHRELFSVSEDVRVSLSFRVGAFSSFVGAFVGLFGLLTVSYSLISVWSMQDLGRYYAYVLWAIGASFGVAYADNFLLFVISWEIVTLMLFLLVNLGKEGSKVAAGKAFSILGLSDGALLLGVILLWSLTGNLGMTGTRILAHDALTYAIFALFVLAALAKAGAFPVHTWVPAIAEPAPTPVMAFLPAAVDKLLGIYLLARVSVEFFEPDEPMMLALMIIGAVTILGAVLMAMVQHNLKRLLGFHAVSQVGYMVLGIGTGTILGIVGSLFHMLNNAIYKSCLFFGGGAVEEKTGTTELDELGGLAPLMPVTFVCMLIAALSISGVPPFNGFASKWMIYQGVLESESRLMPLFLVAAIFGSALTLASFVKLIHSIFWQRRPKALERLPAGEVGWLMQAPLVVLAALCILFGVFARIPVQMFLAPSVEEMGRAAGEFQAGMLAEGLAPAHGLWSPTLATALIILGLLIGLLIYVGGRIMRVRTAPVFVGGERVEGEKMRMSGTSFYETIRELPFFSTAFKDAESSAYDVYYVGGKLGGAVLRLLRTLHDGVLTTYMSWVALGLMIIGALVAYVLKFRG